MHHHFAPISLRAIPKTEYMTAVAVFFCFYKRSASPPAWRWQRHHIYLLHMWQPIIVDLSYTIQPCSRATRILSPHDDRLASFRNSVLPANNFCKYTRAVDCYVIFLSIVRLHTYGLEVAFVCDDISGGLLSGVSGVSIPRIGKSEPTSLLANLAPLPTMYAVTSAPAVLSYTRMMASL